MDKLSNQTWAQYKRNTSNQELRHRVAGHLESTRMDVNAVLADTTMKLSDLMNLQPGDLVLTEKPASSPLALTIGGRRKFIGHLAQFRGNRAFKVKRPIQPKDRV